jgi:hypothetical protein
MGNSEASSGGKGISCAMVLERSVGSAVGESLGGNCGNCGMSGCLSECDTRSLLMPLMDLGGDGANRTTNDLFSFYCPKVLKSSVGRWGSRKTNKQKIQKKTKNPRECPRLRIERDIVFVGF